MALRVEALALPAHDFDTESLGHGGYRKRCLELFEFFVCHLREL
jgi:hypothetical protein